MRSCYLWMLPPFLWSLVLLPVDAFWAQLSALDEKRPRRSSRGRLGGGNDSPTWSGDRGEASYSDDWLLEFHFRAQNENCATTDSLAPWNDRLEREQASVREWQESFQRNGLADFTPPMSVGLDCLLIGGDDIVMDAAAGSRTKLPWEDDGSSILTSLQVAVPPERPTTDAIVPTRWVSDFSSAVQDGLRVSKSGAASFDCIVDRGLLGAILHAETSGHPAPETAVRELLLEASLTLREHGIYVLTTEKLSPKTVQLLERCSADAGLEWQFALDGISNHHVQVSVARRFNNGAMPKVGRLSRYRP